MQSRPELVGAHAASLVPTSHPIGNPLFDGADPDVLAWGDRLWIYPTSQIRPSEPVFEVYSSADLSSWKRHGCVLDLRSVKWVPEDGRRHHCAWAPGVFQDGKLIYLYFSVGPQHAKPSRIGVAVANNPLGPFIDSGRPLISGGDGFEAIDAMVFRDPISGGVFLYCGGSAGARLRVFELESNLVRIRREWPVQTPPEFTEASYMHYRNGLYYLSYSRGFFGDGSYCIHYSTAKSPLGPWTYQECILSSSDEHLGPGHHCFLHHPVTGAPYIFYHRWNGAGRTGKKTRTRSVCIEHVHYGPNGRILPVTMSNTGVQSTPFF